MTDQVNMFDADIRDYMREAGIEDVNGLLEADPDALVRRLQHHKINSKEIARWQSRAAMSQYVNGVNTTDADLLSQCGISDPDQLSEVDPDELHDRIQRFLDSNTGSRFARQRDRYDRSRTRNWTRRARKNRDQWRNSSYARRRNRSRSSDHEPRQREQSNRKDRNRTSEPSPRSARDSKRSRTSSRSRSTASQPSTDSQSSTDERRKREQTSDADNSRPLRFYLEPTSPVVDAPSIGPKMAERFEAVKIITIEDFLSADPDQTAERLNHKRTNADMIRLWQEQSRLMCQVPQLRGHDAQILVACDVKEPQQLASMNPQQLFSVVEPFSKTKDGARIIRAGRKPDLEEVTDWITWSKSSRNLKAA